MLVLTRRVGERLVVEDDVFVKVLEIKDDQVRIGIKAPITKSVHREEIHQLLKSGQTGLRKGRRSKKTRYLRRRIVNRDLTIRADSEDS